MLVRRSLDITDISFMIMDLTYDSLFLNTAFTLPLKRKNFAPGSIFSTEWMVFPLMFNADIPVGPNKRTQIFSGSLQLKRRDFEIALYTVLTRCDLPVPPLP